MRRINLNPILNAIKGKNKAGKLIYGVLGVSGVAITGSEIGMNDIQLYISLGLAIIGFLVGLYIDNPRGKAKLEAIAESLSVELMRVTDTKSDGGEKITKAEMRAVVLSVLKTFFTK